MDFNPFSIKLTGTFDSAIKAAIAAVTMIKAGTL